jgi:hypothetical protein
MRGLNEHTVHSAHTPPRAAAYFASVIVGIHVRFEKMYVIRVEPIQVGAQAFHAVNEVTYVDLVDPHQSELVNSPLVVTGYRKSYDP